MRRSCMVCRTCAWPAALVGTAIAAWTFFSLLDLWLSPAIMALHPHIARVGVDDPLVAAAPLLLEPAACGTGVSALVAVVSHAGHTRARAAQRRAWPAAHLADGPLRARRIFLLAMAPRADADAAQQDALRREQSQHGDLLQGAWVEDYRLLLRKHLLALRWLLRRCAQAQLLLKMDDDVAVDVPWLLQYSARRLALQPERALLLGHELADARPQRREGDKWRLSRVEFADDVFPRFLSGWAYTASASAARALLDAAATAPRPALWIDDLYVTGVLAERAGVKREGLPRPFASDAALLRCCLRTPALRCDFAAAPDGGDPALVEAAAAHARLCARAGPDRCPPRSPARPLNATCVRALQARDHPPLLEDVAAPTARVRMLPLG